MTLKGFDSMKESGAEMNDFGIFKLIHGELNFYSGISNPSN